MDLHTIVCKSHRLAQFLRLELGHPSGEPLSPKAISLFRDLSTEDQALYINYEVLRRLELAMGVQSAPF